MGGLPFFNPLAQCSAVRGGGKKNKKNQEEDHEMDQEEDQERYQEEDQEGD